MLWTACRQVIRKWQHEEVTTAQSSPFFEIPFSGFLSKREVQNPMLWLSNRSTWQNRMAWPVFLVALGSLSRKVNRNRDAYMWIALSTRSLKQVITKTVTGVIALPWIAPSILVTPFLLSRLGWTSLLFTPAGLLIIDFLFIRWAKHKLNKEFRTAASQLYDSRQGSVQLVA